jgi:hypothetical protein
MRQQSFSGGRLRLKLVFAKDNIVPTCERFGSQSLCMAGSVAVFMHANSGQIRAQLWFQFVL